MSEFYHIINVFKHRDPYNALCPYPITETYNIYCDLTNANQDPQDDDGWELKDMAEWNFDESVAWIYHCAATREFSVFDIPLHNFRLPGVDLRNKRCKDIVNLMVKPNVDFEVSRRIAHTIFDMLQCRLEVERARSRLPDGSCIPHVRDPMSAPEWSEDANRIEADPTWSNDSDESLSADEVRSMEPARRPRGRPKGSVKRDRQTGSVSVPEFLRDLLFKVEFSEYIEWVDISIGKFKFVNPDKVAKLWGEKKQNKHMNFPKFSRAMRYHYLNDVLARCSERLVYRFGSNAPDYKTNNPYLLNATPKFIGP
ncbi:GA-binding protein alpha chain-like [Pararge aegeria]|uniref:GA-binding protein alpha chain-like n=1 Tax=Pararge aegeria TaxID=116150 RepID=UPI0019CF93B2|nr:GA-binding protein alpha chain-like [Pararge aegeria]